jgi:hypothetical protein
MKVVHKCLLWLMSVLSRLPALAEIGWGENESTVGEGDVVLFVFEINAGQVALGVEDFPYVAENGQGRGGEITGCGSAGSFLWHQTENRASISPKSCRR